VGHQAELRGSAAGQLDLAGVDGILIVLAHAPLVGSGSDLETQRHRYSHSLWRRFEERRSAYLAVLRAVAVAVAAGRAGDWEGAELRQPPCDLYCLAALRELLREAMQNAREILDRLGSMRASSRIRAGQPLAPPAHGRFYHVYQLAQIECLAVEMDSF